MRRASKFWRLPAGEKWLLVTAWIAVGSARVALATIPFARLRQRLERSTARAGRAAGGRPDPERIAWAVHVVSRAVPGGSRCLPRAVATQYLLRRRGYPAELRLGVRRDERQAFRAHAWVVCDGLVLIGAEGHEHFTPLEGDGR